MMKNFEVGDIVTINVRSVGAMHATVTAVNGGLVTIELPQGTVKVVGAAALSHLKEGGSTWPPR